MVMIFPRKSIAGKADHKELEGEKGEPVIWWYFGICKKRPSIREPHLLVCFRSILAYLQSVVL